MVNGAGNASEQPSSGLPQELCGPHCGDKRSHCDARLDKLLVENIKLSRAGSSMLLEHT